MLNYTLRHHKQYEGFPVEAPAFLVLALGDGVQDAGKDVDGADVSESQSDHVVEVVALEQGAEQGVDVQKSVQLAKTNDPQPGHVRSSGQGDVINAEH